MLDASMKYWRVYDLGFVLSLALSVRGSPMPTPVVLPPRGMKSTVWQVGEDLENVEFNRCVTTVLPRLGRNTGAVAKN